MNYDLDTEFSFGFFKGLSLERVYRGVYQPELETLESGLLQQLYLYEIISEAKELSVTTVDGVKCYAVIKTPSRGISKGLLAPTNYRFGHNAFTIITTFNFQNVAHSLKERKKNPLYPYILTFGHTEYLQWCVAEMPDFRISDYAMLELQKKSTVDEIVFETYARVDNFYFFPKVICKTKRFPNEVIALNAKKEK